MKYFFILACGFASLFSCSSDDPAEPVDTTKEPGYQKGTLEYLYFVEKGLKPSQQDSVKGIGEYVAADDYQLLAGQRNRNAWLSKFDKSGNEIYSYELQPAGGWKYSFYPPSSQHPLLLINSKFIFLVGRYTDEFDISYLNLPALNVYGECISILDFNTGKEITKLDILRGGNNLHYFTNIIESNNRYLIHRKEVDDRTGNYNSFTVIDGNGKELYTKPWREEEDLFLGKGFIFLDDTRVAPRASKTYHPSPYSIIDLKTWTLLKKYTEDNLPLTGDHWGEDYIRYRVDTTYLEGNHIKYVYEENYIKDEQNEITGKKETVTRLLGKYYYHINIDDYSTTYMGKLE